MKSVLIAESGGTKTDWCLIRNGEVTIRKVSFSMHPANWNADFFVKVGVFLNEMLDGDEVPIVIYSAGCHQESNRQELASQINSLGYETEVQSDLVAGGRSVGIDNSARIAILGTGSVLFTFANDKVIDLVGGKGYQIGDEGSGYYFGKLVLDLWKEKKLNDAQIEVLEANFERSELVASVGTSNEKYLIASIAKGLSDYQQLFLEIHRSNFKAFCESHEVAKSSNQLYVIGGYGFHHRNILEEVFGAFGVGIVKIIQRPIDLLIEQTISLTD